jgi:hypothetical protein
MINTPVGVADASVETVSVGMSFASFPKAPGAPSLQSGMVSSPRAVRALQAVIHKQVVATQTEANREQTARVVLKKDIMANSGIERKRMGK